MFRTVVCRSAKNDHSVDRAAAARAALPHFAMIRQVSARPIETTLNAARDDVAQNATERRVQLADVVVAQRVDRATRMNRRLEQRLIRIQIADASNDLLRHQQRLHRAATPTRDLAKSLQRERRIERIDAE